MPMTRTRAREVALWLPVLRSCSDQTGLRGSRRLGLRLRLVAGWPVDLRVAQLRRPPRRQPSPEESQEPDSESLTIFLLRIEAPTAVEDISTFISRVSLLSSTSGHHYNNVALGAARKVLTRKVLQAIVTLDLNKPNHFVQSYVFYAPHIRRDVGSPFRDFKGFFSFHLAYSTTAHAQTIRLFSQEHWRLLACREPSSL